jgi:nucleoside 2-deoxyribosyltransferase
MNRPRAVMTIHLTGNVEHLQEDWPFYHKIMNTIHLRGHVLARNWIEPAYLRLKKPDKKNNSDRTAIFEAEMEAITRADLVIIEGTRYSFGTGYHAAIALQQKKPVLFVARDTALKHRLVGGITDNLLKFKVYKSEEELEKIIDRFIQENTLSSKDLRFNFFLDRQIYSHLRWASFKSGKTKAEIIRDLIDKEIEKSEY